MELKPIRHRIVECGHAVLLIEKEPNWSIPSARFSVCFRADPKGVLKYGANGLHFVEHIVWNVIANGTLKRTNASTYSTGEMAVYGNCCEKDFDEGVTRFLGGLTALSKATIPKEYANTFIIEQRRVACETYMMTEQTSRSRGEQGKMFVYNSDMVRSQYSFDYVWHILLGECMLGRVVVMAHCHISAESVKLFESLATEFTRAWDARGKKVEKPVALPYYYVPPFSMLTGRKKKTGGPKRTLKIPLGDDLNCVESAVVLALLNPSSSPYPFVASAESEEAALQRLEDRKTGLDTRYDFADPFFAAEILSGRSGTISEEMLADLYSWDSKQLMHKYGRSAAKKLIARFTKQK